MSVSMSATCCSLSGEDANLDPCASLPPWFVRLRYFYGKRLGAADLYDEQLYFASKMRFQNRALHGSGILCGLGVSLFEAGGTVLRVGKGAAIDRRGREIIVGYDQCVDVAAWYLERVAANAVDPGIALPKAGTDGLFPLFVALRYAECNTHPEPAPRDPCGCGDTGCDFGRVREGFELLLLTEEEASPFLALPSYPGEAALLKAASGAVGAGAFEKALAGLLAAGCDDSDEPGGSIILGSLRFKVEADKVTAIPTLEQALAPFLLPTAALQALVLQSFSGAFQAGWITADAPEITKVDVTYDSVTATATFTLTVSTSKDLAGGTVANALVSVTKLDDTTQAWTFPAAGALTAPAWDSINKRITVNLDNTSLFLTSGLFRFSLTTPTATPIVDTDLRPLRPFQFSYDFRVDSLAPLVVSAPPFAG